MKTQTLPASTFPELAYHSDTLDMLIALAGEPLPAEILDRLPSLLLTLTHGRLSQLQQDRRH